MKKVTCMIYPKELTLIPQQLYSAFFFYEKPTKSTEKNVCLKFNGIILVDTRGSG